MNFKTLLVTGGAGFIGCNFVKMLLNEEPELRIVNLDALTYAGNLASLADCLDNNNHIFVKGNICNRELVEHLVRTYQVDGIINFAAESHVDRSITGPEIFAETNIQGTMNLLAVAKEVGVKRYLQVSTDEVYGSLGADGLFKETTPISPNSPYSASKASADHMVQAWNHTFGIDTVITRCSNNYGPLQFPEKLIPLMINNTCNDKQLPVYGDGMNIRDWLYVEDHCRAIWLAMQKGGSGEVYNIGGNNEKTNLEIVKTILSELGKPESLITFVADRLGHDRRYAIDATKISTELGWKPLVAVDKGIPMTIKWYLDNKSWMADVTSGDYMNYYNSMYGNK